MSSSSDYYFAVEADLQNYCLRVLRSKGIQAQSELYLNGLRADIVTPDTVIECKKVLTRDAIWQAYGQASEYRDRCGKERILIVGQAPRSESQLNAALGAAQQLQGKADVSFVESDPFWRMREPVREYTQRPAPPDREYIPNYSHTEFDINPVWAMIIGLILILGFCGMKPQARTMTVDASDCPEFANGCTHAKVYDRDMQIVGTIGNGGKVTVSKCDRDYCETEHGLIYKDFLR